MTEWISVKDELPETDVFCLVLQRPDDWYPLRATFDNKRKEFTICDGVKGVGMPAYLAIQVSHWMTVPEPPEVDDD